MSGEIRKFLAGYISIIVISMQIMAATPTVSVVKARQRYPWNGKVDIDVTVQCATKNMSNVELVFAATNCATKTAIQLAHITQIGDDSWSELTLTRHFVWDARADVGSVKVDDVALSVDAFIGVQLWEDGPFWAECNVGATKPEENGYYFWWGDVTGCRRNGSRWDAVDGSKVSFLFYGANCPTYNMNNSQLSSAGYIDSSGNLVASHDAATAYLGVPWRMPTESEFSTLISKCDTTWTTRNGVYGRLVKGRGSFALKSIFLPASGVGKDSGLNNLGMSGYYGSSTVQSAYGIDAWHLYFQSSNFYQIEYGTRYSGRSVRPLRGALPFAGLTTHLALDCRDELRLLLGKTVELCYDASWYGNGSYVCLTDNGVSIATGSRGTKRWTIEDEHPHCLKLTVFDDSGVRVADEVVCFLNSIPLNGAVDIPVGWTEIPAGLFMDCGWLRSVRIPNGVTSLGARAFYACSSLERIIMPCDLNVGADAIPSKVRIVNLVSVSISGMETHDVYDGLVKCFGVRVFSNSIRYDIRNITDLMPAAAANVGTYQLELAAEMFCNTNENYEVAFEIDDRNNTSCVVVMQRPVTVTTASAEKTYDGDPLTAGVKVGGNGFVAGECEVEAMGTQTAVGVSKNMIALNWAEGSSPANYEISKEEGSLTVLPAEVSSNGEEPWGGDDPRPYVGGEGVHSLYNTESTYDGFGHAIDVETLSGIKLVGGDVPQISYALTSNGVYQAGPIYFTNSCFTSIWYKVESPNHKPYIHEAGISILPRPVRVVSESAQKNYDGMPLTAHSFRTSGMGFVGDDGVELSYEGTQKWPGSSANDFSYRFKFNTRPENYDVVCEYGTLKVGAEGDVSIHAGETSIPENAFAGCVGITQVTIPESVTSIGANAFSGCVGLKKIAFPSKMVLRWSELRRMGLTDEFVRAAFAQGDWLVAGCVLLAYVGDRNVSELSVPDGIEIIEEEVFAGLYNLQKIYFCGTEKEIGPFAFRDCTYLDDVVLPDTVEVLGEGGFSGCSYIFDFDMGNGVREIGESAFEGCQTIENMVCSTNLLDVGRRAFADCYYLRDVALPLGVTNVATSAFAGCAALTGVTVPTHVVPLSRWFPEQYKSICSVTIPDDETEMVPSMFEGCQSLGIDPVDGAESIILPEGLTVIPDRAFADCSSIVQLTLPTGVVSIGEAAFERCQFVSFEMPDAVTTVGKGAFRGCSALKDVTLAKSLTAIPDELFAGCASLDSFTVPGCVAQLGANFVPYQTSAIYFMSNAPVYAANAYDSANVHELVNYVKRGTMGWNGQPTGRVLPTPAVWPANTVVPIKYWEANQFEAVFDANGGYFANPTATTFACKETTFESYAIPPYDPIRPGYVFTGWWTDPMGGSRIRSTTRVTLTKPNDEVQTIYAHWKKGEAKWVTIRFNAMGGTVSPAFTNCVVGEIYGNALKSVVPTKEYYDFYGWYTMAYWPDGELQTAETIVPDADRELFARWEPKTYAVRYHANGGTGTMADGTFVYGDKFNLAANQFKRAGHAFAGWASTADGVKKYNDGAELSDYGAIEDGVVDLYAVWVAVDCYYSIRFDSNGGVGTMTNQTVRIGDTVPLDPNRFTRTGYAFAGWALRADDYEKVYDDQEHFCNLSETDGDTVSLFAVWVSTRQYLIKFDVANGQDASVWLSFDCGCVVKLPPKPSSAENKHFVGWFCQETGRLYDAELLVFNLSVGGKILKMHAVWSDTCNLR